MKGPFFRKHYSPENPGHEIEIRYLKDKLVAPVAFAEIIVLHYLITDASLGARALPVTVTQKGFEA